MQTSPFPLALRSCVFCVVVAWSTAGIACKGGKGTPAPAPSASAVAADADAAAPQPAASAPAPTSTAAPPTPPAGYLTASILRVVLTPEGSAVLLRFDDDVRVLPIFVGGTEGLSIGLRFESRRYPRPLTHDLLDGVAGRLGGTLVKVHVDSLSGNIFIGRVFYRQGDRTFDIDARPSDAMALAIGNRVPIFVAFKVLEAAGIRAEDIAPGQDDLPDPRTGRPDEPTQL